jgi:ribosomal protein L14E/L6E/L27E
MSSYKYPTKFRNTEAEIPTVNPKKLIVGQDYLIQHIKEGLPSIFLYMDGLSAKQKKAIIEKVITRFRGRFVKYITGNDTNLESENPEYMMPIGMGVENERVAVFEDVDIISGNDKNIFSDGIYVIKNTETPKKHVIGTTYREAPDKSVKDTQFKELIKGRKYYTAFDISKWAFAPTISRKIIRNTFNQVINQSQDPNLSNEENQLIDFRRDVVAVDGITNTIAEYLGTEVPEIVPRSTLNTNQSAIINSDYNNARMANAQNVNAEYENQQNDTRKRNTATAELAAREFTDVDGGSRRRKTRRSKMRKNKTRSKRRKHTKRHRK